MDKDLKKLVEFYGIETTGLSFCVIKNEDGQMRIATADDIYDVFGVFINEEGECDMTKEQNKQKNNCEYEAKCIIGKNCDMNCFEIGEEDIFYKGEIYHYKNNRIAIIKKGLYQGADGRFYPYSGKTVEGSGAKDLWDFIRHLYNKI